MSQPGPVRPAPGTLATVAPGLLRACMPLPGPPSHVNCWLIADGEGWLLVDTGAGDAATRALWRGIFADSLGGRPLTRVLVTHFHPDHVGLAGWICAEWGVPLLMPRSEWQRTRLLLTEDEAALAELFIDFQRRAGAGPQHLAWLRQEGFAYRRTVAPLPRTYEPLAEGDLLQTRGRQWRVRIGAGHSPEMACLHDEAGGILISTDHILPRISPHIGLQPTEPDADPLGTFIAALESFSRMPAGTHVLPSHGEPFRDLRGRIATLRQHHETALTRLAGSLGSGLTASEALPVLFDRTFEGRQLAFALSEALAHLSHLRRRGQVQRHGTAEGIWRFETTRPEPRRARWNDGT
ncbi:Glyoxylase, beta-lactamase superfamily II [Roseomonas rosea]|uniref:Glyoxylase, beta-lactamase superfamily II n=1 Tax=Muricoccus roseus TaxID=198092 RepID=A0A1M6IFD1_9PROT|nr:MBL fold metallo-hydrolase [Roseomonas rosea]SHJ33162.1 Glyoxylase, beta-lactamase superfamily II [Roseomonas rosea]